MALENISDWLQTGLEYYTAKRAADRSTNLQAQQINAQIEGKKVDAQIAIATAQRAQDSRNNPGFTDKSTNAPPVAVSPSMSISNMPNIVWYVLIGIAVMIGLSFIGRK